MSRGVLKKLALFQPIVVLRVIFIVCILILIILIIFPRHKYASVCSWKQLIKIETTEVEFCPITPKNLVGALIPDLRDVSFADYERQFSDYFQSGGHYKPADCMVRDRVAILIPLRGKERERQIPVLLKNLHPILMRQQLEYQVFVIYQAHGYWFNRGALFNAGFVEAMKIRQWDCFIFHDVDTIPADDRNFYDCPRVNPRHMAVAVDKYNFT